MSRREHGQYDAARRSKDGVAFRCRSQVGRSRVRRAVENDNSGCVGKESDQHGGVEKL
ncbi:hypothetical protein A2U01_0080749, partial [Trifolium medium]|nr:hypothetical protein [Trifolium medium]